MKILGILSFDNYKNGEDANKKLTLLYAANEVLKEVDGDSFWRGEVRNSIYREELVHLVLGAELRGELGSRDALRCRVVNHDSV